MFYFNTVNPNSSGGGESPSVEGKKKHIVRVIDYDGKILKEEFLYEGQTFKMPNVPTHERMTFNYWEGDEPIVDGYVIAQDYPIIFGAIYTVNSGKSEFDIEVPNDNYSFTLNMDGEKDWGDGTIDSLTSHTYATAGSYMILCDGQNITGVISPVVTEARFGNLQNVSSSDYPVFSGSDLYNNVLTAVSVNDGLEYISSGGFVNGCMKIKGLVYPKTLTSSQYIISMGCANCVGLKTLVIPSEILHFNGVNGCPNLEYIVIPKGTCGIYNNTFQRDYNLKDVHIPEGLYKIGDSCFRYCYAVEEIEFPKSLRLFGEYVCGSCYSLKKVIFNKNEQLTSIPGNTFENCGALSYAGIPDNISSSIHAFAGSIIEDFPQLTGDLYNLRRLKSYNVPAQDSVYIEGCDALTDISFDDNIKTINLSECQGLSEIIVPKKATSFTMYNCQKVINLDFDKCETVVTLGGGTSKLYNLNTIAKICVPFALYNQWITDSNWSPFADRIYVKNPAHISLDISASSYELYVNGNQWQETSFEYAGSSLGYICKDTLTGNVIANEITGITEGAEVLENIDFENDIKTITLNVGVAGLSVSFYCGNIPLNCTEESDGIYITQIGGNCEVSYTVAGGSDYMDATGTINFTGTDITESVTLIPATTEAWANPILSSNGTMGQSDFAVDAQVRSSGYPAYYAVNGSVYNRWECVTKTPGDFFFFCKEAIALTGADINVGYSDIVTDLKIYGSNDNSNWNELTTVFSSSESGGYYHTTATVTNTVQYNYYKMSFYCSTGRAVIYEMTLSGIKKVPVTQE